MSDTVLDFVKTGVTDLLVLELHYTFLATAEAAGGVILGEDDLVALNVYFNGIGVCDIHFLAHFLGYYNSAELVDVSDYSGRFHCDNSFLFNISILA